MPAFGPLSALFHEADRTRPTDAEVAWYAQRMPEAGGPALALMCGIGRTLVPLVAQGRNVHGVDTSAAMLARCEERLAARQLTTPLYRQDIAQMNLPQRYGCAYVAGGSFQLVTDPAAAAAALARIRAHLVEPGLLLIDCYTPAESAQRLGAPLVEVRTVKLPDDTQIALRSETTYWADARLTRADNRYAQRRGAQLVAEERETLTTTWYAADDFATIVRDAGFRDVEVVTSPVISMDYDTFALTARA